MGGISLRATNDFLFGQRVSPGKAGRPRKKGKGEVGKLWSITEIPKKAQL